MKLVSSFADSMPQRLLSDQHLGILGGSAIGLTSILITVVVISCRQRCVLSMTMTHDNRKANASVTIFK